MVFFTEVIQTVLREAIFIDIVQKANISSECNILSTGGLAINVPEGSGVTEAAVASLVIILLPVGLMLVVGTLASILICCSKTDENPVTRSPVISFFRCNWKIWRRHSRSSSAVCALQCFLLIPYLFGDNIDYIMYRYGDNLGCKGDCPETVRTIASTLSVLAAVLLNLSPHVLNYFRVRARTQWNYKHEEIEKTLHALGTVVKIEAVYNALLVAATHRSYCHPVEHILGWLLLVICVFFATISMFSKFYKTEETKNWKTIGTKVLLAFVTLLFLLSDNSQPLDCAFNCDPSTRVSNTTATEVSAPAPCCDIKGNATTRLVLIIVAFLLIAFPCASAIAYKCYKCYKRYKSKKQNRVQSFK